MDPIVIVFSITIACLLMGILIPQRLANALSRTYRHAIVGLIGIEFVAALALGLRYINSGQPIESVVFEGRVGELPIQAGYLFDGPSVLMLILVSFVGLIVSRFSVRYLDGEPHQGRYSQWLGFTIGAVSLMVVASDLVLYVAASVLTSAGLHRLLVHYPDRLAAKRAAWTKFVVSRIGDVFLVAAVVLIYRTFGTLQISELFESARTISSSNTATNEHLMIAWLLILAGLAKSAQFPFHTWLPNTMETPTPVSALMHAGIVNSGGYLIIRLSPIIALGASSLTFAAIVGAATACFAGIAMMTQPSIKRSLAYSTIAQMGFMMFQCGIGAFSSAMTHLIVHSLYKAHAFLGSGSVIDDAVKSMAPRAGRTNLRGSYGLLIVVGGYAFVMFSVAAFLVTGMGQIDYGAVVLTCVFCLALTTWGWRLFTQSGSAPQWVGLIGIAGLCLVYVTTYSGIAQLIGPSLPSPAVTAPLLVAGVCALLVCLIPFAVHLLVVKRRGTDWLNAFRVHASNGFYIDALLHRAFAPIAKS